MASDTVSKSQPFVARLTRPEDDPDAFTRAVAALAEGALAAVPTETVYGLACDATDPEAVARLYAAKGRPSINPLIAHVADIEAARREGVLDDRAERLAAAFWPGPLTLVVQRSAGCSVAPEASAGLSTLAIRVPAAPLMQGLARALGRPIAAPSANLSGRVSATTADAVVEDLGGRVAVVLDAGPSPVGVESTIVDVSGEPARLLRPGGIPRAEIERVLQAPLAGPPVDAEAAPAAPGLLSSHYAPRAKVRLDVDEVFPGEALLAFGPSLPRGCEQAMTVENLSPTGDLAEAAANLFSALRRLDRSGAQTIAVAPFPREGLGEAISDRLARAAAPRGPRDRAGD